MMPKPLVPVTQDAQGIGDVERPVGHDQDASSRGREALSPAQEVRR
jgi:hypothetical protein